MNEIQEKLLIIYKEFLKIAEAMNINFFAAGGSMIGAVRHNGFIPWDDDIDIYIPRKDYDKFISKTQNLSNDIIFVQNHYSDSEWFWPYTKIRLKNTTAIEKNYERALFHQGLWIDVFPLDRYTDNPKDLKKDEKYKQALFRRISIHYKVKYAFKGRFHNVLLLIRFPGLESTYKKVIKLATKYNNNPNAKYLSTIWDDKTKKKVFFSEEKFNNFTKFKFEDTYIPVSQFYEELLTQQYGNWKKEPNSKDRKSGHEIAILDLKKNYDYYLLRNKQ